MLFRRKNPNVFTGVFASVKSLVWPQKGFMRGWIYLILRILRLRSSNYSLAVGIASGVAVSFTPLIGVHFVLAAVLAWILRGNFIMAMIGTIVGNPWTFPLIWVLIYNVGMWLLGDSSSGADVTVLSYDFLMDSPGSVLISMLLGGLVMGSVTGVVVFALAYGYAGKLREKMIAIKMGRKIRAASTSAPVSASESDRNV